MQINLTEGFKNEEVISSDGTHIGYRKIGNGPGLILLHGALQSSLNFTKMAKAMSSDFTVYLPDRRGRGLSGPYRLNDGLMTEAYDLVALIHHTKAVNVFALSSGAIITLKATLLEPSIKKIAIYEPPLAITGHPFNAFDASYTAAIQKGNYGKAFLTILKGTGDDSWFTRLPYFFIAPLLNIQINKQAKRPANGEVPLKVLVGNFRHDRMIIEDSKTILPLLKKNHADTLLLGGTDSLKYFSKVLDFLQNEIPLAKNIRIPNEGHLAADNSGRPLRVAEELMKFFKTDKIL